MALPLVIVSVAVAAKAASSIWFSSRATSPLSEGWRREFLYRSRVAVEKLERLNLASPEKVASLRADLNLLKEHVAEGWSDTTLFDAATRVSWSMGFNHTVTGVKGVATLVSNYAALAGKSVGRWTGSLTANFMDDFFSRPAKKEP